MPDPLPRWVVLLTLIVALVAISLRIEDYVEYRKAVPPESTPTVADSNAVKRLKRTVSAKTKRARLSASESNAAAIAQASAADIEKRLLGEEFSVANGNALLVMGRGPNSLQDQALNNEAEASMDGDFRSSNELDASATPGCLPLPNLTKPGDVDAPYYENWARTYCGLSR